MLLNKRIPLPYIINKVKVELLFVLLVSLVVALVTHFFGGRFPAMPLTIPAFIGTAISILLSFKLNQSYDRWWEARKVWGSIVNDSRTLILQLQGLVKKGNSETIRRIAHRQIFWSYALGQSLRGLDAMANSEKYLNPKDIVEIKKHKNKPLALANLNVKDLTALHEGGALEIFSRIQLDHTMVRLVESMGKAERIKGTVFPVTYRVFLHFMIYIFVITLSLSLGNVGIQYELPLLLVISAAFFLLEKTARHMQDPFENSPTDTAMTTIASTIETNIRQLLNDEQETMIKTTMDDFYIL